MALTKIVSTKTPTDQMVKKRNISFDMGRRRALENKTWEADILWQMRLTKTMEERAFLQELEFQTLTQEAKKQELLLLLKILDLKFKSEVSQAMALETKAHENTCMFGVSGRRARYLLRLKKTWYLDKAQQHRNRAKQLVTALGELEILFLKCSASMRQIRQQKLELLSQQDSMSILMVTNMSPAQSTYKNDIMCLALHNNLIKQLDWQKMRTAQQEASSAMYSHLFLQQQQRTTNLQVYYNGLKVDREI